MQKTHAAVTGKKSALARYRELIVGDDRLWFLLYYEFCVWLAPIPGALGLALRGLFWPRLFACCGRGVLFGRGITLRHPGRIQLGDRVVLSEGCILDARHPMSEGARRDAIVLGNGVMLADGVMLSCKGGGIRLGDNVGVNTRAVIQSVGDCPVHVGDDCVIGQGCLLVAGGSYDIGDRDDGLIRERPMVQDGGLRLENNVWLGARVTVLGGVNMGSGSVAGAGAVITKSIPSRALCVGVPARVVRTRQSGLTGDSAA